MSKELVTIRNGLDTDETVKVVDINDDLGGHRAIDFHHSLDQLVRQGEAKIVVNLSNIRHTNSTAIGTLVGTAKKLRQQQGDLKIFGLNADVKRIFNLVGASTVLEIYDSERQAVSAFQKD